MKFIEKLLSKNLCDNKNTTAVSIGAMGEEAAVKTLKKNGYKIIDRNFRTRGGEIDIIALDGEYTCFVEVRLRKSNDFGLPADTVDIRKRRRIINTAKYYAVKNKIYDSPMRFDVVTINARACGNRLEDMNIQLIKNAFYIETEY